MFYELKITNVLKSSGCKMEKSEFPIETEFFL